MKIVRHFMEILAMALVISILYYIKVDVMLPYILPVTLIGVVGILVFAFFSLKKRGWLSVIILFLAVSSVTHPSFGAFQRFDCGGQHNGKSAAEAILGAQNAAEIAAAATQAAQDAALRGNVFKDEFSNNNIKACVLLNIISIGDELCGQKTDCEEDYDPQMRQNAIYAKENYLRMSADTAGDDIDNHSWITNGIGSYNNARMNEQFNRMQEKEHDANDVYGCVEKYIEHCACVDKKKEANCRTIAETVKKNSQDCWVCSIVEALLLASQKIAKVAYALLSNFAIGLLGVMFLFWIAIKVLHLVGTFGYGDHNSFFTEFLFRSIAVMISAAILHAPVVELYRIVFSPFIMMTAAFTEEISEAVLSDEKGSFYDTVKNSLNVGEPNNNDARKNCMLHCENMLKEDLQYTERQQQLMYSASGGTDAFIDPQSFSALLCLTCRTYNQMVPFTAIGETMTCYAFVHGYNPWFLDVSFPDFSYWLMGATFVVLFSLLMTVIAFYILDIVLKLAFIFILTPLFVVAWAFPISREYTKKAWDMILYALFEFIGVAVMVAIFMVLMMNALGDLPVTTGNIEREIVAAMKDNNVPKLYELMGGVAPWTLLKLIVVCLMGYKMITSTSAVVSALSGISPGIPGVAMSALTGMVKGALALAGVSAGAAGMAAAKGTKKAAGKIGEIAKSRNASKGRFNKSGGPTNTRQAAAQGIKKFSAKSRQAGSSVGAAGENLKARGKAMSEYGREMAARKGVMNKIRGNLMRAGGAVNKGVGGLINKPSKAIGGMMNKVGQAVANTVDKSGVANTLQRSGDKSQRSKEAALRADPAAAARRERGYNRIAEGAAAIGKNLNVVKAAYLIASGFASVARSKVQRGTNQLRRGFNKRFGNRKN